MINIVNITPLLVDKSTHHLWKSCAPVLAYLCDFGSGCLLSSIGSSVKKRQNRNRMVIFTGYAERLKHSIFYWKTSSSGGVQRYWAPRDCRGSTGFELPGSLVITECYYRELKVGTELKAQSLTIK